MCRRRVFITHAKEKGGGKGCSGRQKSLLGDLGFRLMSFTSTAPGFIQHFWISFSLDIYPSEERSEDRVGRGSTFHIHNMTLACKFGMVEVDIGLEDNIKKK